MEINENKDLVSIVMPAYNASETIMKSINSVLNQTYENWELLVINDCSKDETLKIVTEFSENDSRIKIIDLKQNGGVANARNVGVTASNGDFIAFLDSDDQWISDKLTKQIKFMNDQDVSFSYTDYSTINLNGEILREFKAPDKNNFKNLLKSNSIGCLTVVVSKEVAKLIHFKKIGHEDYLCWLSVLNHEITAYNVGENLALYLDDGASLSSNKLKAARWQWNIYRNEFNLSLGKSAANFVSYLFYGVAKRI